jgi:hypothetical protein
MSEEQVSPELALVDPELAARLRAAHVPPCTIDRPRPPRATAAAPAVVSAPAESTPAEPTRRRWRLRPLELVAAAALVVILGAAFLPSPNAPTFAAPVQRGEIVLAWPEARKSDVYLLQILDGPETVYERRLEEPHLDEVFALVDGRRYRWRVFVTADRPAPGSKPIARGSFVLGG